MTKSNEAVWLKVAGICGFLTPILAFALIFSAIAVIPRIQLAGQRPKRLRHSRRHHSSAFQFRLTYQRRIVPYLRNRTIRVPEKAYCRQNRRIHLHFSQHSAFRNRRLPRKHPPNTLHCLRNVLHAPANIHANSYWGFLAHAQNANGSVHFAGGCCRSYAMGALLHNSLCAQCGCA